MNADRYHPSEYIWFLQLRNKGLERKLETFRSGSAYTNLRKEYESVIRKKKRHGNQQVEEKPGRFPFSECHKQRTLV